MQNVFRVYIVIIIVGFILLLLSETEKVLVTVNDYHGPSSIDIAGLFLIILCWVMMFITTHTAIQKDQKQFEQCRTVHLPGGNNHWNNMDSSQSFK